MEKLLKQLSLEKYWPVFDERNIRYNDFLKLSEQDLKDIGIKLVLIIYHNTILILNNIIHKHNYEF